MPQFEKKQAKKRVLCAGKTFAPYGMKLGGGPPVMCKVREFEYRVLTSQKGIFQELLYFA